MCQIKRSKNALADAQVCFALRKSDFSQNAHIPRRAKLPNVHSERDLVVFPLQGVCHADMPIGTVRGNLAVLCTVAAHVCGVICVKIQKHPAGLQDTEPFPVSLLRLRQRPCEIPAEHHVEAAVVIRKRLRVHFAEHNIQSALRGDTPRLIEHGRCQVDALDLVSGF